MGIKISQLPLGAAEQNAVVPSANVVGTATSKIKLGDIASLAVQQFADFASFPATGDVRFIYLSKNDNSQYRWDGSAYVSVGVGGGGGPYAVGAGTNSIVGSGLNNTATGDYSVIGGGKNNTASNTYSTVSGGYLNHATGDRSTVGGGRSNTASAQYSTVSGGQSNNASGYACTVSGGANNTASSNYSTVGGGQSNTASAARSTVGGGANNTASSNYSTVGGGGQNNASGYFSTVGGGVSNTASGYISTVGGGDSNTASNQFATVGGGQQNAASSYYSAVAGGRQNNASGDISTVSGGRENIASSAYSTVGGGRGNTASAYASTVSGGIAAVASHYGAQAHAAGRFLQNGDAQTIRVLMRTVTAGSASSPSAMFLDGSGARLTLPANAVWHFNVRLSAVSACANAAAGGWTLRGVIKRMTGGTVSLVGSPIVETWMDTALDGSTVTLSANDTAKSLDILVLGAGGEAVAWVAAVEITQVIAPSVSGCIDPTACNYNPAATCDDGSCLYGEVGCTDPWACNYNPAAGCNDGSCYGNIYDGCGYGGTFLDYCESSGGCGQYISFDGCGNSCDYFGICESCGECAIYGCTDPASANYNPDATCDDGSCTY